MYNNVPISRAFICWKMAFVLYFFFLNIFLKIQPLISNFLSYLTKCIDFLLFVCKFHCYIFFLFELHALQGSQTLTYSFNIAYPKNSLVIASFIGNLIANLFFSFTWIYFLMYRSLPNFFTIVSPPSHEALDTKKMINISWAN
jgi:hypothetical protein